MIRNPTHIITAIMAATTQPLNTITQYQSIAFKRCHVLGIRVHLLCDSTLSTSAWQYSVGTSYVLSAHTIGDAGCSLQSTGDDVMCPNEGQAVRINDRSMSCPVHIIHNFHSLLCRLYSSINRTKDIVTLGEAISSVFTVHFLPVRCYSCKTSHSPISSSLSSHRNVWICRSNHINRS